MKVRKGKVNGALYDVISPEDIKPGSRITSADRIAVHKGDLLYPIIGSDNKNQIGATINDFYVKYNDPPDNIRDRYLADKNVIDFSSVKNMREFIENSEELSNMEYHVLSDPDNIFKPIIRSGDTSLMKALKTAIAAKNIDIDKYQHRFGSNFNNDKRLLNKSSVTISKVASIGEALDMKVEVIISDASPNVPNPMGTCVRTVIVGDNKDGKE
jgi:hypothetical protein